MRLKPNVAVRFLVMAAIAFAIVNVGARNGQGGVAQQPGVFLTCIGVVMTAIGVFLTRQQFRLRRKGQRVTATVAGIERGWVSGPDSSGSSTYRPVLRFRTLAGEEIETTSNAGTPTTRMKPGQPVPVIYDPAKPRLAEIDSASRRGVLTVLALIMLVAGPAMTAGGVVALLHP